MESRQGQGIYVFFPKHLNQALGLIQIPIHSLLGCCARGKALRQRRPTPSSVEVKHEWSYNSAPSLHLQGIKGKSFLFDFL